LCLEVAPTGSKLWRFRYRYGGRAKMLALGRWNEVTLQEARERLRDARKMLANGIDPMDGKRAIKEAQRRQDESRFSTVALAWLDYKRKRVGDETFRKAKLVVEGDLIPALRRHTIDALATKDVVGVLARIEERAPNLALKARQYLSGIVTYA